MRIEIMEKIYEDIVNISRVLPHLPASIIYNDLKKLIWKDDRVRIILRQHLSLYDIEIQNSMSDDIKRIKRILPDYPIVEISKELALVKDKEYRVQLVLKKYFESENSKSKRFFDDLGPLPNMSGKKMKTGNKPEPENDHNKLPVALENGKLSAETDSVSSDNNSASNATEEYNIGKIESFIKQTVDNYFTDTNIAAQKGKTINSPSSSTVKDDSIAWLDPATISSFSFVDKLSVPASANPSKSTTPTLSRSTPTTPSSLTLPELPKQFKPTVLKPATFISTPSTSRASNYNCIQATELPNTVATPHMDPMYHPVTSRIGTSKLISKSIFTPDKINNNYKTTKVYRYVPPAKLENSHYDHLAPSTSTDPVPPLVYHNFPPNLVKAASTGIFVPNASTSKSDATFIPENQVPLNQAPVKVSGKPKQLDQLRLLLSKDVESVSSPDTDSDDVIIVSVDHNKNEPKTKAVPLDANDSKREVNEDDNLDEMTEDYDAQSDADHPYFFKLMEMFPDVCPDYLRKLCNGKKESTAAFDELISVLLDGEYKRRVRDPSPVVQTDFDEQYKILLDLFPDADPTYLQHHCERLIDRPDELKLFVAEQLEHKSYPSKAEHLKKLKLSAQEKQYTTEFNVKKFLEVIPDPEAYYNDPKRKVSYIQHNDNSYALIFLKNYYSNIAIREITSVFKKAQYSLFEAAKVLDHYPRTLKIKRKKYPVTACSNIPLLQEIAYLQHKYEIQDYMKQENEKKLMLRKEAKEAGSLKTCGCCFDDEVMPDEIACCEAGHIFCKECVRKGSEVQIGLGKLDFPCLETCESHFSLQVLQSVLTPKVFSKMVQRKQLEEVKAAGVEGLEFCPFCDFATIPAPDDKLFRCLNNDCMKESCRQCREVSHIPLRCEEVEKENDIKMRTYIENKMTEALIRICYKCGLKFVKSEGCNKMTCSCGALMCYICNQPVKDYTHFNGQGGDKIHLCPLYSDTVQLHKDAVKRGAESAKKELGIESENKQLKIDPTQNLDDHFRAAAATTSNQPNPLVNDIMPLFWEMQARMQRHHQ